MTLLSRILGFSRDVVLAHVFGAMASMDAFIIAFKIPNFMRRITAEGAFSQAFVPVLAEYKANNTEAELHVFISRIGSCLALSLLVLILFTECFAPQLIRLFAPGFRIDAVRFSLAVQIVHYTLPYLLFISLVAYLAAILNAYGRFALAALNPIFLNLCLIAGALLVAPRLQQPVLALGFAVFVAGIIQLLVLIPAVNQLGLRPRSQPVWRDQGVRRVVALMLPALFGASVAQVNLLIDTLLASFLPIGSVSWLYYSDRLTWFPLSIFGVAIATVILPNLSQHKAAQDDAAFGNALDWGLRLVSLIALPAAAGLFTLAGPLLASLFQSGQFTNVDVVLASRSLKAFALGLPAMMLIKVFASAFYSNQDVKTPVKIGLLAMLMNTITSLILLLPLAHLGLAIATTLSAWLNALLLGFVLVRRRGIQFQQCNSFFITRVVLATCVMVVLIELISAPLSVWLAASMLERIGRLLLTIVVAKLCYVSAAALLGLRWQDFK